MTIEIPDYLVAPLEALVRKYADRYDSEELARENIIRGAFHLGLIGLTEGSETMPDRGERVQ